MIVFVGYSSSNDVENIYFEETKKLANILCKNNCT